MRVIGIGIKTAELAREALNTNWVKHEVVAIARHLNRVLVN
jgi:thiazole synthase ThiGH ThiG subunit